MVAARPNLGGHVALVLVGLVSLFPLVWMYLGAFHNQGDLFTTALFSPNLSLANYARAIKSLPIGGLFFHTAVMSICVALGQLMTSLLAAYAFTNWSFPGQRVLFLIFVGTWLIPFQVTMLPNYVFLAHLGLLDTLAGVILPQLSSAFAVILLRQHFKAFPKELIEAARVDGQSSWATLWSVIVPNLVPALAALGILLFVNTWNEYFWPLLVFRNQRSSVVQLGLQVFLTSEFTDYSALMAAAGLACLPALLVYAVLQRRIVNAFVRSGLR